MDSERDPTPREASGLAFAAGSCALRFLVTVKTYPIPSAGYDELVCAAGVREDGSFVRLYPVPFRYRPEDQQYGKYQWISVQAVKSRRDPRPESFRPELESIEVLGRPVGTGDGTWAERRRIVLANGPDTMCGLRRQNTRSLGIVRPKRIESFRAVKVARAWPAKHARVIAQAKLFGPDRKPLRKLPYQFKYRFRCEAPGCRSHTMTIEDWEVGTLYWRMLAEHGSEDVAILKVHQKFYGEMCAGDRDTHFFVGNTLAHPRSWLVLGVFWPRVGTLPLM
jgi:hypothetical protein